MRTAQRRNPWLAAIAVAIANVVLLPLGHGTVQAAHGAVQPGHAPADRGVVAAAARAGPRVREAVTAGTPRGAWPDIADLVDRYGAAVVNITVTAGSPSKPHDGVVPGAFHESTFFRYFGPAAGAAPAPAPPLHGEGSGFIVDSHGVILTNAHVVQGAASVIVKLTDRREFQATVLGADLRTDIAVLKIAADGLPVVRLGSDARVRVGEWVVAIGSPYGFENSVTSGIVSAKARALPDDSAVPFLQTDVPLNPGNSGGPLFDLEGHVIGINSQIFSRTGGYQGIGFAIPIDLAMKVARQILKTGRVEHGHLGVDVQDLSPPLASAFGLTDVDGALVGNVEPDSPAAHSGLQPGDVVRGFNGQPLRDAAAFAVALADQAPDAVVRLDVWRRGDELRLTTTLIRDAGGHVGAPALPDRAFGLAVRALTPQERIANGIVNGLFVEGVTGAAARAGLLEGDVVLAINGQPLLEPDQLTSAQLTSAQLTAEQQGAQPRVRREQKAAVGVRSKPIALLVRRGGVQIYVPVQAGREAG